VTASLERRVRTKVEEFDQLKIYTDLLDKFGAGCGFCAIFGDISVHRGSDCPRMTSHQKDMLKYLQANIHYEHSLRWKPCFTCHICSFGKDRLHPAFEKGNKALCPNPNLVLPLIVAIRTDATLKALACISLKAMGWWTDINDFIAWFSTANSAHKTQGMAIIAWYSGYMKKQNK
jgi:hypothetical protein